jgi:hypothetical protein
MNKKFNYYCVFYGLLCVSIAPLPWIFLYIKFVNDAPLFMTIIIWSGLYGFYTSLSAMLAFAVFRRAKRQIIFLVCLLGLITILSLVYYFTAKY